MPHLMAFALPLLAAVCRGEGWAKSHLERAKSCVKMDGQSDRRRARRDSDGDEDDEDEDDAAEWIALSHSLTDMLSHEWEQ